MRNIILDCDPGHDDAIAILLAGSNPEINLLGVTVVAGNQTLEKTANNALKVVQWLGLDVPVIKGCPGPMVRKQMIADDIHGETGLDGHDFGEIKIKLQEDHAVNFIIDTILNSKEKITVVTCGPMTNLAMALRLQPKIKENIEEIVLMGGAYTFGNVSPAAEFNIIADAEAAYVCFTAGLPITMMGLDVTRKVQVLPEVVERMDKISNKAAEMFVNLMKFFNKSQKEVFGWDGGPLHDPLTVAYLIDPSVVTLKKMNTRIDIRSTDSYGRTNCDYFDYLGLEKNSNVAIDVDVKKYWDIIEKGIRSYND
ncbi:nucleoside hydrolase [Anaerococcus sp. Marseille-P3625]|uniref:nucleoside hydrolase n=1 Tax=Anaerococcus sp. Marseille-P3625 TaxID=1977277 RepID=UPI000C081246|nr:nucleoside hydrolase [Anaerococcus sp. Marseille-P3625]